MSSDVTIPARRRRADRSLIREAADSRESVQGSAVEPPAPTRPAQEYRNWNVRLPAELVERIYGACDALSETEDIRSNVGFTVRAMDELLTRLEAEHNGGRRYSRSDSPFRAGRPVSYRQ